MTLTKLLRMTNTFTRPAFIPLASFQFSRLTKYEIFFYLGKKVRLCLSSNQPCLFVSHLWMLYPKWLNVDLFQVSPKKCLCFCYRFLLRTLNADLKLTSSWLKIQTVAKIYSFHLFYSTKFSYGIFRIK